MNTSDHSLAGIPFLSPLDEPSRKSLGQRARRVRYRPGETTFDQLRAMRTGTATFSLGNIPLTQSGGPIALIAAAPMMRLWPSISGLERSTSSSTTSFISSMVAPTRHSHTTMRASARAPAMLLTRAMSKGPTTLSTRLAISLPPPPTDGSAVDVTGQIRNDQDAGKVAARALVTVTINNGTDVISGEGTAAAATGGGCCV
jgi:hypothetical protein